MSDQVQLIRVDLVYEDPEDSRFIERVDSDWLELPIIEGNPPVTIRLPIEVEGELFFEVFEREASDDWHVTTAYRHKNRIPRQGGQAQSH